MPAPALHPVISCRMDEKTVTNEKYLRKRHIEKKCIRRGIPHVWKISLKTVKS